MLFSDQAGQGLK